MNVDDQQGSSGIAAFGSRTIQEYSDRFHTLLETNPVMTSVGSRFDDTIWDFSKDTKRRLSKGNSVLDFSMQQSESFGQKTVTWLPNGRTLADYPDLYKSGKVLFAAMRLQPRSTKGRAFSVSSYITVWAGFRILVQMLVRHGMTRLADLDAHTWNIIEGSKAKSYVFRTLYEIHVYRDLLACDNSFMGNEEIRCLNRTNLESKKKQTPWIPDEVFQRILQMSFKWLERSEYILKLQERSLEIAAKARTSGYKLGPIFEDTALAPTNYRISNSQELTTAAACLQIACVLLIHAVSGMRLSEVASLDEKALVTEVYSDVPFHFLKTIHSKFSPVYGGNEELWLCGECGATAYKTLLRLSSHYRKHTKTTYVICPTRRLSTRTLKESAKNKNYGHDFVRSLFNYQSIKVLPRMLIEAGIVGSAGEPIRIRTHQFRRTFARWAARSDSETGLLALQDHFKHASLLMTTYYAYVDDELLLWFEEERANLGIQSFDKILTAEAMGGVGGLAIKRELDEAVAKGDLPKEFRGSAFRAKREELVKKWMLNGIYPRYCSGHYCVPRDPTFECEKQGGGFGCNVGTCPNAVYLPEHAPLLRMEIDEEVRLSEFLENCSYGKTPYAESLRVSIRAKNAHLASLTKETAIKSPIEKTKNKTA